MNEKKFFFNKKEPSIFVISTPFQALCACSAIKNLEIHDYLIIVVCSEYDPRKEQTFAVLDIFKFKFKKIEIYKHIFIYEMFSSGCFGKKSYSRAFVGDYHAPLLTMIAFKYLKINSIIVYLDDGSSSIGHLKGTSKLSLKSRFCTLLVFIMSYLRFVKINKIFYTIYFDIPTKKYVGKNDIGSLLSTDVKNVSNNAYFIGTNSTEYCSAFNISQEDYLNYLENALFYTKRQACNCNLFYIPHGKDKHLDIIIPVLNKCGVRILKLNECVEIYFVKTKIIPFVVSGFMSTALYTTKLLSPKTKILGFMTEESKLYKNIAEYYKDHKIEIVHLKSTKSCGNRATVI